MEDKKNYYLSKVKTLKAYDHNDFFYKAYVFQKDDKKKALGYINKAIKKKPDRDIYHYFKSKLESEPEKKLISIDNALLNAIRQNKIFFLNTKYDYLRAFYGDKKALNFAREIQSTLQNSAVYVNSINNFLRRIAWDAEKSGDIKFSCEMHSLRSQKWLMLYQKNSIYDKEQLQRLSCKNLL